MKLEEGHFGWIQEELEGGGEGVRYFIVYVKIPEDRKGLKNHFLSNQTVLLKSTKVTW